MTTHPSIPLERRVVALLLCAFCGLFAAVGSSAFIRPGSPWAALALLPLLAAPLCHGALARRLPAAWDGLRRARPLLCALWLLLALAALGRSAGVGLYMADPQRPQASAIWFDPFYVNHSCLSGYWKAAELSHTPGLNIYQERPYEGKQDRFKLDEYLYPPQFLLLPRAASALLGTPADSFLPLRALWFALDATLLAGAMLALCGWIGGAAGRRAALLLPAVWLALPTLVTLQTGNFQLPAIALSVLAMLLFQRGRALAGGALLALAMVKIFPAILCAYLLFTRRWRALACSVAFSLLFLAAGWAVLGAQPFRDFIGYELPRIASGELWAWLELEGLEGVVAINHSVPGLVFKLRLLGLPGMDHHMMANAAWVWSLALLAIAWLAARHAGTGAGAAAGAADTPAARLRLAALWIALLGLAALRSPFTPDDYALFPALWLWCLLAAAAPAGAAISAALALLWLALAPVMPFSLAAPAQLAALLALSTASQLAALALCLWFALRRPGDPARAARRPQHSASNTSPFPPAGAMSPARTDSPR
jgi:alpha-1,2-mannosyltransferase